MIETTLKEALKSAYNRGAKDALDSCREAFEIACAAAIEQAVQAEREACARVCEELDDSEYRTDCGDCAAAIRARGRNDQE